MERLWSELVYQFYHAPPRMEGAEDEKGTHAFCFLRNQKTPLQEECASIDPDLKGRGCGFCFSRQVRGACNHRLLERVKQKAAQYSPGVI